jgi:hypothetical protein
MKLQDKMINLLYLTNLFLGHLEKKIFLTKEVDISGTNALEKRE